MGILDDMGALVDEFASFPDWEARYRRIIELGRALDPMDEALKVEENRVRGCASTVWLHAAAAADPAGGAPRIVFRADSDAILVRGLVALLLKVYNRHTAREILGAPPDFLEDLGLNVNLSANRANGLTAMAARIREYAQAYQAPAAG